MLTIGGLLCSPQEDPPALAYAHARRMVGRLQPPWCPAGKAGHCQVLHLLLPSSLLSLWVKQVPLFWWFCSNFPIVEIYISYKVVIFIQMVRTGQVLGTEHTKKRRM